MLQHKRPSSHCSWSNMLMHNSSQADASAAALANKCPSMRRLFQTSQMHILAPTWPPPSRTFPSPKTPSARIKEQCIIIIGLLMSWCLNILSVSHFIFAYILNHVSLYHACNKYSTRAIFWFCIKWIQNFPVSIFFSWYFVVCWLPACPLYNSFSRVIFPLLPLQAFQQISIWRMLSALYGGKRGGAWCLSVCHCSSLCLCLAVDTSNRGIWDGVRFWMVWRKDMAQGAF